MSNLVHNAYRQWPPLFQVGLCLFFLICTLNIPAQQTNISAQGTPSQKNSEEKQILLVHSQNIAYSRFFGLSQGFIKEMNLGKYHCYIEDLELKRSAEDTQPVIEKRFATYYDAFSSGKYDAIVTIGGPAYNLVYNSLDKIHPKTACFFIGTWDFVGGFVDTNQWISGTRFSLDIEGTLKMSNRLFPNRKEVVLLSEAGVAAEFFEKKFQKILLQYPGLKSTVMYGENYTDQELIDYLKDHAQDVTLIYYAWNRPATGLVDYFRGNSRILYDIFQETGVPIFVMRDYLLQEGVVGGSIIRMEKTGSDAAQRLKKHFDGVKQPCLVFDMRAEKVVEWDMLQKFGIPLNQVPRDITITNRPFSLWEKYQIPITTTIGIVFFVLSILLGIAVWHISLNRKKILTNSNQLQIALKDAQAAEKAKSNFLATMSHEIRTPLSTVINLAQLLQGKDISESDRADYLSAIKVSSKSLLLLINDILDLSKLDEGKVKLIPKETNIPQIIKEIQSIFEQKAKKKNINLHFDFTQNFPTVWIDSARLRQIILNLLGNAIKFTEQGEIRIHAEFTKLDSKKGSITLSVSDTGIGMSDEFKQKLFTPFTQDEKSLQQKNITESGTGLGLSISQRLAKAMNGTLSVKSQLGQGSTFTLHLREVSSSEPLPQGQGQESVCIRSLSDKILQSKILIVDDQQMNLMVLDKVLRKLGLVPFQADSGRKAVEVFEKEKIDIVFTDLRMPDMDGEKLSQTIRTLPGGKEVKIFIVTANIYAESERKITCVDQVLFKPLTLDKLRSLLIALDEQA